MWFMVDDKLHGHRKTARVSDLAAMGLWVLAGSWCADHMTDGFIPDYVARRLDPRAARHGALLVTAGFWNEACRDGETGWQFHDWDGIQRTRAEIEQKRSEARERMRRNRERSQEVRANGERSSQSVTPTPAHSHPNPAQPISKSPSGGGSPTDTAISTRPPRTCPKHPDGTDEPCGPCADARKAHDAWQPPTPVPPPLTCEHGNRPASCKTCARLASPPPADWRPTRSAS